MTDRRRFLQQVAAGAAGLPVLSALGLVREAFGQELSAMDLGSTSGTAFARLQAEYLLSDRVTYLNHASIGTIPRVVHDARVEYLRLCESNPHQYMWGGAWEEPRESVRAKAATMFGCHRTGPRTV